MKFNQAQLRAMYQWGLKVGSTSEEAKAFYDKLDGALQAQILALAETPGAEAGKQPGEQAKPGAAAATTTTTTEQTPGVLDNKAIDARVQEIIKNDRAAQAKRMKEIHEIAKLTKLGDTWALEMINGEKTVEEARGDALDKMSKARPAVSGVALGGVSVGEDLNLSTLGPAMSDAILMRAGATLYEFDSTGELVRDDNGRPKKRKAHERSQRFRMLSLLEMSRQYLAAIGIDAFAMPRQEVAKLMLNRRELYRRSAGALDVHSTSDFDNILQDLINKTLRARYAEISPNWSTWARQAFASDFKTISRTQLSGFSVPPIVREGAEYTYATKSDSKETYTLVKYGQIFQITWEALINDDLDAFVRIPANHVASCARLEDDIAYAILTANAAMSDSVALFHDGSHGNDATAAVLSVASLGAAKAKMRKQTGLAGEKLDILPVFLIVPVALETTAKQLVASAVDPSKNNAVPNPFNNDLTVVPQPRLDTDSATAWYLAASPMQVDTVEVCFLEGQRQPVLEEEAGFDVDARKYKVRHVVAAKAIDHRGLLRNEGA